MITELRISSTTIGFVVKPQSSKLSFTMRYAKVLNVIAWMSSPLTWSPRVSHFLAILAFISLAPASVKVINNTSEGFIPSSNILAPRSVIHSVFPEPAVALTLHTPLRKSMTFCWASVGMIFPFLPEPVLSS